MFTWGPQQAAAAPSGPAPIADFYALRSSGAAAFDTFVGFTASGSSVLPLAVGAHIEADEAQTAFLTAAGTGAPQTWESLSGEAVDAPVNRLWTDAAAGVNATVTASSGRIVNVTPGATDGLGRYSVAWTDGADFFPADGGSKLLTISTNGSTVTFSFSETIGSFGLHLIDYLDFGGQCTWKFYNGPTLIFSEFLQPTPLSLPGDEALLNGSVGFIGYVAKTTAAEFDRVEFVFDATASDRTGFDNIFVGSPEQIPVIYVSVGQSVQFYDISSNSPTSWLWNFGDTTTSTLQNPTKTYSTAGTRTVTLTATNAGGSDLETKTGYIVVS